MFNNGKVTKVDATNPIKQVWVNSMPFTSVGVVVAASAANGADGLGRAIVLAGTPLTGDLKDRVTAFTTTASGVPTGVLMNDVPVWDGDANGSLMIDGCINYDRCETAVQTLIDATDLLEPGSVVKVIRDI